MEPIWKWVRRVYRVEEPQYQHVGGIPLCDGMVRAYDRETGTLVGEWPAGGLIPHVLVEEYASPKNPAP